MDSSNNPYLHMFGAAYSQIVNERYVKAKRSGGQPGDCVLCAVGMDGLVGIQDSKLDSETRKQKTLIFTPIETKTFIAGIKDGRFDYLVDFDNVNTGEVSFNAGVIRNCVQCTVEPGGSVRIWDGKLDSETSKRWTLFFTPSEMSAFILGVKDGEFDHLVDLSIPEPLDVEEVPPFDVTATPFRHECRDGGAPGQLGGSTMTARSMR